MASGICGATLLTIRPFNYLGAPTLICKQEIDVAAAIFILGVALWHPVSARIRPTSLYRVLGRAVSMPRAARATLLALGALGAYTFAFWAVADVLGGYNGYGYAFSTYPALSWMYSNSIGLIPYLNSADKGTQASIGMGLAGIAITTLKANRGIGRGAVDASTYFVAPLLVAFEFALWYFAPQDMSWHVTDFLTVGGLADGGWRTPGGGGSYLFSNWLVLWVSILVVCSRAPGISLPSRIIWGKGNLPIDREPLGE